jgi:hypothetical protein
VFRRSFLASGKDSQSCDQVRQALGAQDFQPREKQNSSSTRPTYVPGLSLFRKANKRVLHFTRGRARLSAVKLTFQCKCQSKHMVDRLNPRASVTPPFNPQTLKAASLRSFVQNGYCPVIVPPRNPFAAIYLNGLRCNFECSS